MNRIERRFKREIGKNIESFDAWAEKHREELAAVGVPERAAEAVPAEATAALVPATAAGPAVRQKRPFMKWVYSGAAVCLAVLCVILAIAFYPPREENYVYSDSEVKTGVVTEAEIAALTEVFQLLSEFSEVTTQGVRLIRNNALLMLVYSGELETESDYYLVTVRQWFDKRYNFISKNDYSDFTDYLEYEDLTVEYKFVGVSFDGFNQYLMGFEKNNITYYFSISCFSEDLTEFIGLLVKDLQN